MHNQMSHPRISYLTLHISAQCFFTRMVEETIPGVPTGPGVTAPPITIMIPEQVPTPSFDSFCGTHLSCRQDEIKL